MQTLEIARELQQAGISENSAYEIAEAINGRSGLATKEDIHEVREEIIKLEGQMIELKTAIKWLDKSR